MILEFGIIYVFNIKELLFFQPINTCCMIQGSATGTNAPGADVGGDSVRTRLLTISV